MTWISLVEFIHDIIEESKGTNCYKIDLKDKIFPQRYEDDKAEVVNYCEKLTNILTRKYAIEGKGALTLHFNWEPSPPAKLHLKLQGPLLKTLVEICGKDIWFAIALNDPNPSDCELDIISDSLEIMLPSANEAFCEYQHEEASSGTDFGIHLNHFKCFRVFIIMKLEDYYLPDLNLDQLSVVCKTVQENIQKDVTILANSANGQGQQVLLANKVFLMAHSPVLKSLFEGNFAESKKNEIKMEYSLECVQALLDYMFTMSFEAAVKSSRLAVELFQAAHYYQIQHLENKLVEMFLERGSSWFEADVAIQLFKAATQIQLHSSAELKKKAFEILKSKGNLRESAEFGKLFEENPTIALEFTLMALEI